MRSFSLLLSSLLLSTGSPLLRSEETAAPKPHLLDPVDAERTRPVPVKVYRKPSRSPQPVVIFSHGLGGSRENSAYLGDHWAEHGYVAVFVQHAGSDEEVWKSVPLAERMDALKKAASLKSLLDRFADIPFVIDRLEEWNAAEDHALKGTMDLARIGLCGHSFGAVTTQGLMGQRFPLARFFGDDRIRAFVLFSPSAARGLRSEKAFGEITAPVLCMTGTKDDSPIQPELTPASRLEVYASLPEGDKYQLVFDGGSHFAFSDVGFRDENRIEHHHPAIQKLSTRFWDAYLKDDEAAKAWLRSEAAKSESILQEKDRWEWK